MRKDRIEEEYIKWSEDDPKNMTGYVKELYDEVCKEEKEVHDFIQYRKEMLLTKGAMWKIVDGVSTTASNHLRLGFAVGFEAACNIFKDMLDK